MKRCIDEKEKSVYFRGDYPSCMAIPHIMRKDYPGYTYTIVSWDEFERLQKTVCAS